MKVKIGPYRYNWVTTSLYDKWMYRKYGVSYYTMAAKDYTKTDKFIEKLDEIVQDFYNITINQVLKLRSNERKVSIKLNKYDTWNMNETLARIVVPMLKQLKESKQGAPHVDIKDTPKHLHPTEEDYDNSCGDVDEKFFQRWEYVLDEMIFAFEAQYNDWESKYYSGEIDHKTVPIDHDGNEVTEKEAVMFRLEDGPNHTFEIDDKGMKKEQKRIDNGLKLFAKYYASLWD